MDRRRHTRAISPRLCMVAVGFACACGDTREPPPFTFVIRNPTDPHAEVLNVTFASYDDARDTGPYAVTVTSNGVTRDVTVPVDFCEQAAPCTGPLRLQLIEPRVEPLEPDGFFVSYYRCDGLDGSIRVGIDAETDGACR